LDLHLDLDAAPGRSLRARLENSLRDAIRSGVLAAETRLPSSRELCLELGVSRGVVVDAYAQLAAEGYLHTRRGGGTVVAPGVITADRAAPSMARPHRVRYDMSPYQPALGDLPRGALAGAVGRALKEIPDERLGLPDPAGVFELRSALSSYLGRVRGVRAAADEIMITTSTRHGIELVWRALASQGARRVAVEDPGWSGVRETAAAAGLELVPVPVDDDGLDVDRLEAESLDAVALAPAHQYPTGAVLSAERRRALLSWAERRGATIVEDDYDAEYRYDHQPIGSLQGLAPARVAYLGSTSKTLAPSVRIGWLVAPPGLLEPILQSQQRTTTVPSPIFQFALAELIERGELDRHLRRQRRSYQRQRSVLLEALADRLPELTVRGAAAGLYVVLDLAEDADEAEVVATARSRGIALEGRESDRPGLVIGYASIRTEAIRAAVAELADCVAAAPGRGSAEPRPARAASG
jgi:GntR family transcriptional regulator / MocR family aminotransferase